MFEGASENGQERWEKHIAGPDALFLIVLSYKTWQTDCVPKEMRLPEFRKR